MSEPADWNGRLTGILQNWGKHLVGWRQDCHSQGPWHALQEVELDDPETPSNINIPVILHLYLVHTGDVSPCGVTGFGAPVTSEIDQHLSCKENTAMYNACNRTKNSKAISSLHIFFVLT